MQLLGEAEVVRLLLELPEGEKLLLMEAALLGLEVTLAEEHTELLAERLLLRVKDKLTEAQLLGEAELEPAVFDTETLCVAEDVTEAEELAQGHSRGRESRRSQKIWQLAI